MKQLLALVLVLFFAASPTAAAAPSLTETSPRADAQVTAAPKLVRLTFDRKIAGGGPYQVTVTDSGGQVVSEDVLGVDETVITAPLKPLAEGEYTVSYDVKPPGAAALKGEYKFSFGRTLSPVWVWTIAGVVAVGLVVAAWRLARR